MDAQGQPVHARCSKQPAPCFVPFRCREHLEQYAPRFHDGLDVQCTPEETCRALVRRFLSPFVTALGARTVTDVVEGEIQNGRHASTASGNKKKMLDMISGETPTFCTIDRAR